MTNGNPPALLDAGQCFNKTEVMHNEFLISFIVPVFNTQAYLCETLNSIAAYEGKDIEIIIVDDGSTDDSAEIILNWIMAHKVPARLIRQKNSGLSMARMAGLSLARGAFIAFCDSDDRLNVAVYIKMALLCEQRGCDIAICRSLVFDSATEESHDFYDALVWDRIMENRQIDILNSMSEPSLFRLEPNANTRLLRRGFMLQNKLTFPAGLHFEDFPVHVHSLAIAKSVLLMNATGYFYRINRNGKITDQKSAKRFDILKAVALAYGYAHDVDERGLSHITSMACRMIYWCGTHTLNKDRTRFFQEASDLMARLVPDSIWPLASNAALDERDRLLIDAWAARAKGLLADIASKRQPLLKNSFVLLCDRKYGRLARRIGVRIVRRRIGNLMSHFL